MSIPLLRELHQDVRRLVIAGAGIAADDLKLKRMLPQLQQLGEKAPIFKRVAEEVNGVTAAKPEHASGKLLDLAVLLHAVLHTQSSAEAEGELLPLGNPAHSINVTTEFPYRKLKPLLDALTQRGPGRLETIKQGAEDGLFTDFRTFIPAVNGLRDSYAEIAEYIAEKVIPQMGAAVLPILHEHFQIQGNSGDARLLICIYQLTPDTESLWPLFTTASKEGAQPVRIAAISLMAGLPAFEDELLELSHDKKKEIRGAALTALSRLHSDRVVGRLIDALAKKDTELAIAPIQACAALRLTEQLLQLGSSLIGKIESGEQTAVLKETLGGVISCFQTKAHESAVRQFLMVVLSNEKLDFKEYDSLLNEAAQIMLYSKDKLALTYLHELRDNRPPLIGYSLKAALRLLGPAELYDQYEGYLTQKKSKNVRELLQAFYACTPNSFAYIYSEQEEQSDFAWDARWVDRFVELNEEELVCRLVIEPDKKIVDYLVEKSKVAPQLMKPRTVHLFHALFRVGHRETADLFLPALEQATQHSYYYLDREVQLLIAMLPSHSAEKLHQIADKITYEYSRNQLKQLADHVAAKPAAIETDAEGAGFLAWIKNKLS